MKKLILSLLLFPLSLMAANTNVYDNVLIRSNFQFTGGSFGLNKVLTSSAAGIYTPQSILAIEASLVTNVTSTTLTVTGQGTHTLNIETPLINGNTVTNITSNIFSISGQGTKVIDLEFPGAKTNANNFFTTSSFNTFNATTLFIATTTNNANSVVLGNVNVGGQIGVSPGGLTAPLAQVHVVFTNQVSTGIGMLVDVIGPTNTPSFIGRRARGTIASPSAILADDVMAGFNARGFGSTVYSTTSRAAFLSRASENWTDAAQGTYWEWQTTPNGSIVNTSVMRLDNAGNLGIGTNSPAAKLHVNGTSLFNGQQTIVGNMVVSNNIIAAQNISGIGTLAITAAGTSTNILMTAGANTYGSDASSSHTFNGSTFTFAHNANINNGMLIIPVTGTGTITNNTSIFSPLMVTSNMNIRVPSNLIVTWDSGAGTNLIISANGGSGVLTTKAFPTTRTNTLTAALPVINTIYTNFNGGRLRISAGVNLPTGLTSVSAAALFQVSGSFTNIQGITMSYAGVNGAVTNTVAGWIRPNALYCITNITTTAGTPSLVQGMYEEEDY